MEPKTERVVDAAMDALDRIRLEGKSSDLDEYERLMVRMHQDALSDEYLDSVLKAAFLDANRRQAFERYLHSGTPAAISALLARFGINKQAPICDYGCGPGQLGWALWMQGHAKVTLMDPNANFLTGTGFVSTMVSDEVEIINQWDAWHSKQHEFSAIVSKGTIHHWEHIPGTALGVRRSLKQGGLWFVTSEFFANDAQTVVQALENHLLFTQYDTYEWPYPASVYADLIESVGFQLLAVVPMYYRDNAYVDFERVPPVGFRIDELEEQVDAGLHTGATVESFWDEINAFRQKRGTGPRVYSEPQVMIFCRKDV